MTSQEIVNIAQAILDGKQVQYKRKNGQWTDWKGVLQNFRCFLMYQNWRLKPDDTTELWVRAIDLIGNAPFYCHRVTLDCECVKLVVERTDSPAWHDWPTEPGWWLECMGNDVFFNHWDEGEACEENRIYDSYKYYGPIRSNSENRP